jgi:signal transduction histidine kinase
MSGLRSTWSERMFRRLSIRLSRLLSPFRETDHFAIHIESDEFPEYSGELRADFLQRAPYRVEAEFDGVQTISLALNGRRPVAHRWNGQGELTCGPVRIRLFAFDLEGEALARIGPRAEVRAWLREWTGVSIYRDGFRVWPYGEPHDDWLRLDQRRVNNPVERLSNNQVIGFIEIGRDRNPDLMDQTNREGLIHNPAFEDLRRLVYFVFQAIEAERQSIRHPIRRLAGSVRVLQNEAGSVTAELDRMAARAGAEMGRELRQLSARLEEQVERETTQLQQTVAGYSSLAAIGQMTAGLMPVVPFQLQRMEAELARLREILAGRKVPQAREAITGLEEALVSIREYSRMMLAASGSTERKRAIDVVAEAHAFRQLFTPLLENQGVAMEIVNRGTGVLRTEVRPENFCCLLQILATNSLEWLRGTESPRIRIHLSGDADRVEIVFSDNGPGLPEDISARVFDPMFTRKEGGRGMGLTIARQLVEAHGGHIFALMDRRRHGANFQILLPRKRPRATIYEGS